MRYHFFLHYGWFFQNLGKGAVRTFMHTTVRSEVIEYEPRDMKSGVCLRSFTCSTKVNYLTTYILEGEFIQLLVYTQWLLGKMSGPKLEHTIWLLWKNGIYSRIAGWTQIKSDQIFDYVRPCWIWPPSPLIVSKPLKSAPQFLVW